MELVGHVDPKPGSLVSDEEQMCACFMRQATRDLGGTVDGHLLTPPKGVSGLQIVWRAFVDLAVYAKQLRDAAFAAEGSRHSLASIREVLVREESFGSLWPFFDLDKDEELVT